LPALPPVEGAGRAAISIYSGPVPATASVLKQRFRLVKEQTVLGEVKAIGKFDNTAEASAAAGVLGRPHKNLVIKTGALNTKWYPVSSRIPQRNHLRPLPLLLLQEGPITLSARTKLSMTSPICRDQSEACPPRSCSSEAGAEGQGTAVKLVRGAEGQS
jgi:hypothetical protein